MMPIDVRRIEARRRYRALRADPPGIASRTGGQPVRRATSEPPPGTERAAAGEDRPKSPRPGADPAGGLSPGHRGRSAPHHCPHFLALWRQSRGRPGEPSLIRPDTARDVAPGPRASGRQSGSG
jgi:hypothetical protein